MLGKIKTSKLRFCTYLFDARKSKLFKKTLRSRFTTVEINANLCSEKQLRNLCIYHYSLFETIWINHVQAKGSICNVICVQRLARRLTEKTHAIANVQYSQIKPGNQPKK